MHLKAHFGVSRSTNQPAGVGDDAFENDIITTELKILNENDGLDEEQPKTRRHNCRRPICFSQKR